MNVGGCRHSAYGSNFFFVLLVIMDVLGLDYLGGLTSLISIQNLWFIRRVMIHFLEYVYFSYTVESFLEK